MSSALSFFAIWHSQFGTWYQQDLKTFKNLYCVVTSCAHFCPPRFFQLSTCFAPKGFWTTFSLHHAKGFHAKSSWNRSSLNLIISAKYPQINPEHFSLGTCSWHGVWTNSPRNWSVPGQSTTMSWSILSQECQTMKNW